ncbi:hypothetical protein PTTG_12169 [Puccinia triticina 1-1 BBBD Race 1]|uniref:MAGE domain-containing protein n=2 Tax=Puccinia triticina TaxID=208348 RepID=A0A180GLJ4_PUCT1|nr:uncharacterized protein PtA15_6A130 [Puccinia triticina]OAV93349.1 hypothetical protein PTTG_12169 [Puccinia triticina 1-1 BBBD Race 1]WAQ85502.1 hypothetical protein PtA15_6A130 [Puccinia triticina]WAR55383.1 hypothetical protein PtB15_6B124 [Puccinia triticina]
MAESQAALNESTVRDLARYALINELKRRPFKREDISKAELLGTHGRQFDKLLEKCNIELTSVFGMELVEMRSRGCNAGQVDLQNTIKRHSMKNSQANEDEDVPMKSQKGKSSSTKQYVLRSSLKPSLIKKITQIVDDEIPDNDANEDDWSQPNDSILDWKHGDELGHMGILGFVLALILMHGRAIDNSQLLIYFRRLKIGENWQPPSTPACAHPPTQLTRLLSDFAKQGYLEHVKHDGKAGRGGPSQASNNRQSQTGANDSSQDGEWHWGARAEIEFGETQIAEFMSDVYCSAQGTAADQTQPETHAAQHARHEKLIQDITKSAGSALQDSSQLHVPGIFKPAAEAS